MNHKRRALVVVDVQNDFVSGSLAVPGAEAVAKRIAILALDYSYVAATRDWHPADHCSFVEQGGPWPSHCVAGTRGADYAGSTSHLSLDRAAHFFKGFRSDQEQYSGAAAVNNLGKTLGESLALQGFRRVDVVGLAFDYCVKATAIDLKREGLDVRVIEAATAAVSPATRARTRLDMEQAGVVIR